MAQVGDAARDGGKASHVLAHREKRRRDLWGSQGLENPLGGADVGTVVERQVGDTPAPRPATDGPAEQGAVGLVSAVGPGAERGGGEREREEHGRIIKQEAPGTAR